VVSSYSANPTHIAEYTGKITPENFLSQIFYDHASKNSKRRVITDNDWLCSDMLLSRGGFSYLVVNVESGSKTKLGVTVE
jgi:hypothetical protein